MLSTRDTNNCLLELVAISQQLPLEGARFLSRARDPLVHYHPFTRMIAIEIAYSG